MISNPASAVIRQTADSFNFGGTQECATISGTTTKSILLVALALLIGSFSMDYTIDRINSSMSVPTLLMYGSLLLAVVVAFITIFKPNAAPVTAPIYAVLEGSALGSISGTLEFQYPGIVSTAVMSTFCVVMTMLALWKYKIIVPTQRFRSIITGAISAIFVLYIANMIFSLFGVHLIPTTGVVSVGISLIVCAVAAFSLILDFQNIQECVDQGLPKHFEYYNAFSLLVTICWLYIEILKLLSRLNRD
ncbi:MAG: Bax inhibitor-1/YccA family protein [Succinivibrio sp.]